MQSWQLEVTVWAGGMLCVLVGTLVMVLEVVILGDDTLVGD